MDTAICTNVREHDHDGADHLRLYTFGRFGEWEGEIRRDDQPGHVIGLVWQSGYYLTRRGALRATRRYAATGNRFCELRRARRYVTPLMLAVLLVACGSDQPGHDVDTLSELTVAHEGSIEGYERDLFDEHDRQALLDESAALAGCFYSPADNTCHADASDVHVDHLVPLAEAWASGLAGRPVDEIASFGQTPENLWLMTGSLNQAKGDDDPAEWLPPNERVVCDYLERWVSVKIEWELSADPAELAALLESGCFE